MATERPHDTGFSPDFDFHLLMGLAEAYETLKAHHQRITPDALASHLFGQAVSAVSTSGRLEPYLKVLQRLRKKDVARHLLFQRHHLLGLKAGLLQEQEILEANLEYQRKMLVKTDEALRELLEGTRTKIKMALSGEASLERLQ